VSGQPTPSRFTTGEKSRYPLDRGLGGPKRGPEGLGDTKSLGPEVQLAFGFWHQH